MIFGGRSYRRWSCLFVLAASGAALAAMAPAEFYGRVVKVHSGDRLDVMCNGRPMHTRLFGIRCPRGTFGTEARQFTRQMAHARGVHVVTQGHDRFGTYYAQIRFIGGRNLAQELVRAGLARWDKSQAPQDLLLARLESEARNGRRGLWALSGASSMHMETPITCRVES